MDGRFHAKISEPLETHLADLSMSDAWEQHCPPLAGSESHQTSTPAVSQAADIYSAYGHSIGQLRYGPIPLIAVKSRFSGLGTREIGYDGSRIT